MRNDFARPIDTSDDGTRLLALFCLARTRAARAISNNQQFRRLSLRDGLKDPSGRVRPIKNQQRNGCGELKVCHQFSVFVQAAVLPTTV